MPHIAITMHPGRNDEVKTELAQKIQAFVADELKIDDKVVSVSIKDIPKADWAESISKIPDDIFFIKPGTERVK